MAEKWEEEIDDVTLEIVRRTPLLYALRSQPLDSGELAEVLPISRSTIHRATRTLRREGILKKDDDELLLTGLGEVVADETRRFQRDLLVARRLDELLNIVREENIDIPLEHFRDAEIWRPKRNQAHFGAKRIIDLIEESEALKLFTSIISPLYVDTAGQQMMEGTDIEAIFDATVINDVISEYPAEARKALDSGHFTLYVGRCIPFELFLYDETIAISVHDHSGLPQMFVESAEPKALDWGQGLYQRYKERADEFDSAELSSASKSDLIGPLSNSTS